MADAAASHAQRRRRTHVPTRLDLLSRYLLLLTLASAAAAVLFTVNLLVNMALREEYMDEIFHVGQTQKYCEGRYTDWDSKITTFPGLYFAALAAARVVSALSGMAVHGNSFLCSVAALRTFNTAMGCALLGALYFLVKRVHGQHSQNWQMWKTFEMATFPLLFFFNFLFYTDVCSTLLVVTAYYLALSNSAYRMALAGALAIFFRQTNAIWLAFCVGCQIVKKYELAQLSEGKSDLSRDLLYPTRLADAAPALGHLVQAVWRHLPRVIAGTWPSLAVLGAFAAFILVNGGIVIGDRSNHVPVVHLTQPLYLALFTWVFMGVTLTTPQRIRHTLHSLAATKPRLALFCLATAAAALVVHTSTHFTFYFWRLLTGRHWLVKYALSPVYVFALVALRQMLAFHRSYLWLLLFALCTCLALVPAPLVEFRYFIVPFLLLRLHDSHANETGMAANVAGNLVVNAAVLYLFLARPFTWPDGSLQRFMW